jgi:hypothetical protein
MILTAKHRAGILVVSDDNQELNRVLDKVRESGELVMQQGSDQFLITRQPAKISEKGRKILSSGGPSDE